MHAILSPICLAVTVSLPLDMPDKETADKSKHLLSKMHIFLHIYQKSWFWDGMNITSV